MTEKFRGCTSFGYDWVQWFKQCLQKLAASLSIALTCSIFILVSSDSFPRLHTAKNYYLDHALLHSISSFPTPVQASPVVCSLDLTHSPFF